jgi:hypothetical protein
MFTYNFETNEEINSISSISRYKFTHRHIKIISLYTILSLQYYNYEIDDLPNSLIKLYLPRYFSYPVNNLPKSLKKLVIGDFNGHDSFNHPVDNLPSGLEILELGDKFNQPIDNLPNTLIQLRLEGYFNKPIDNLPCSLKILILGSSFNQSLENLPNCLEKIIIGKKYGTSYNYPINNLPESLIYLSIYTYDTKIVINSLPKSIQELNLECDFDIKCEIQKNIKKINIYKKFINKISPEYHNICVFLK